MKINSLAEVEALRAEVRYLRECVCDLEDRLAEADETDEPENAWSIWPYCWFVAGWDLAARQWHHLHLKWNKWALAQRNRRSLRARKSADFGELYLTR